MSLLELGEQRMDGGVKIANLSIAGDLVLDGFWYWVGNGLGFYYLIQCK